MVADTDTLERVRDLETSALDLPRQNKSLLQRHGGTSHEHEHELKRIHDA